MKEHHSYILREHLLQREIYNTTKGGLVPRIPIQPKLNYIADKRHDKCWKYKENSYLQKAHSTRREDREAKINMGF